MNRLSRFVSYSICAAAFSCSTSAQATDLNVTIDTSSIIGTAGVLYFDFISGGNSISNITTISSFTTDGTLGAATPQGNAFGSLPSSVTLDTTAYLFNEVAQNIIFGNQLSFNLNFTQNAPNPSGTPDAFSFLAYDTLGNTLPTTTDPTGSNALFLFNIDGTTTGNLTPYTLPDGRSPWQVTPLAAAVPVPSAVWFMLTGLMGLLFNVRKQQRG